MSVDTFPATLEVSGITLLKLESYSGFMGGNWEKDLAPVIANAIQFLVKFPDFIFQIQVSVTPYIFYHNSLFVQKKVEIGAVYKQGSGLTHSLVQENPEKDNSRVSCSLDCAKYPPPLQSKAFGSSLLQTCT